MPEDRTTDPRRSFDGAADIYGDARPNYPSVMFDELFGCVPSSPLILEVGPGTGQATRDLLSRGAIVHAIEIGPAMAAKLREVAPSGELTITVGDFEQVTIAERSADAVFAASAYHWIAPRAQLDRPARALKLGGTVAIVDLNQVSSPDDAGFFAAAQHIYERYDWNQTYSASAYRKLMLSYSVTQMMEPSARQGLVDDMERFVDEHFDGHVTRPLVVTLTTATLAT